jgi:DNA segregation ATPase FtsK/SpoIIIE, S-DNA-T family
MTHVWEFTWQAGPDAGGEAVLGDGTYIVGRAAGVAIRCDDPGLEPHHLLIEIGPEGARVCQLTGRAPVRIGETPLSGWVPMACETRIEIAHSILTTTRVELTAPAQEQDRANIEFTTKGQVVIRRPRAAIAWNPDPLSPPESSADHGPGSGGLIAAALTLVGSVVVAVVMHQPMFLLFGALGAFVAFGSWGGQRFSRFRHRRRDERNRQAEARAFEHAVAAQRAGYVAHQLATVSTPASARHAVASATSQLWTRRGSHADGFAVSIGLANVAWSPTLDQPTIRPKVPEPLAEATVIADMPLPVDIGAACRMAIRGDSRRARSMVRSIVVQLAANCGPADVRFVVVTHEPAQWQWLDELPHATTTAGAAAVVGEAELVDTITEFDVAPHPHLVVITDAPDLLAARTSPLRRVVTAERSTALIVMPADSGVPHVCTSQLDLCGPMMARWHADAANGSLPTQVRCAGIGEHGAVEVASRLGQLVDPEDPIGGAGGIPRQVTLMSLLPSCEPAAIAASWVAGGGDPPPRTVIGMAGDGVVDIDLDRDGPHALMAGTTGAGKSELLRSLVVGLAAASSPDHMTFVLIDYKGGATFDACAALPHVVGVVTDLDDHLANRALRSLHAELRRREQMLRAVGAADLPSFRRLAPTEVLPRLVVVIDEFAALVSEQPDFLHALVGIAQRGRSLGVHLILATQRPSGVISDDIRANTNLRLALRLHDNSDAMDVVGDPSPAKIPRGLAGRAVMRLGPDEVLTFQTARCTAPGADGGTELDALVAAVVTATELVGARPPMSPWLAPLPTALPVDEVAAGAVGLCDDPDGQRVVPLTWNRRDGHLLLVGAAGSGVTSTLLLLGSAAVTDGSGCHLYVIDGRGDSALTAFEHSPWCGGVVRLYERERLSRVIGRVAGEVGRRIAQPAAPRQPILLLIDGLDAVRGALDDLDTTAEYEMLDSVIANGAANDVVVICAFDRVAGIPSNVLARCAERWVFHLTDPLEASGLNVAAADVPGPQPGRIVVASSKLEAQLINGSLALPACVDGMVPVPVECLPAEIDASELPEGAGLGDDTLLPLGLSFTDGRVASLDVPDGEHLLFVGPPRSGRSTALQRVMHAWRDAYPDGWWCSVTPRRSMLDDERRFRSLADVIDDIPPTGRVLLVIDDAELVDDVGGALAALAASRRPGLLIVATGKPDSLRQSYGHWTGVIRRSRMGVVSSAANDMDGDLLGAVLPRRTPIPPRPGLMWMVSDGDAVLTQVAIDRAATAVAPG